MNHSENSHVPLWLRCYHTNSDFVRSSAPWSSTTLNTAIFSYRSLSNGVPNFFSTIENEIHFREILFHVCVTKIFMRPLILFLFCQFSSYFQGPLVGSACLVPNPTAEPALVRGWELECQPDAWMIPRWEIVMIMMTLFSGSWVGLWWWHQRCQWV